MAEYDLVILGGGPGGYVAAVRASQLGMKTALVEDKHLGGICLNWGCIPTKALLKSAELYNKMKMAEDWGLSAENISYDLPRIVKRSRNIAGRLSRGVGFLMKKNEVAVYETRGALDASGNIVTIEGETLETGNVIVATGSRPVSVPGILIDEKNVITSRTAMTIEKMPDSIAIIGGGAVGVEFAYYFASFGVKVTIIEMLPQILPQMDEEISDVIVHSFEKSGMEISTGTTVKEAEIKEDKVILYLQKPASEEKLEADTALVAIGVKGNVENIGLEEAGVETEGSFIKVDELCRTSRNGVWAVGDVIGPPQLAHAASAEGITAVEAIAGIRKAGVDYSSIPACVYCEPEAAGFGLTETEALDREVDVKIGRFPFRANGKALASGGYEGMVKLVFDAAYGELLGAHVVGRGATELIGELTLAKTHGATAKSIIETVHAHPSLSEAIPEASGDAFGEAIHI